MSKVSRALPNCEKSQPTPQSVNTLELTATPAAGTREAPAKRSARASMLLVLAICGLFWGLVAVAVSALL